MHKERAGEVHEKESKSTKKKELTHEQLVRRQAKEDVDKIRPILEKDRDWPLVTGQQKPITPEDHQRKKRGLTRLTKKATQLLYPEYKAFACYGSGTAHYWVHVNIVTSEKPKYAEERKIVERARMMLNSIGLRFGQYLPDSFPGKDEWTSCLNVEVNDINWGHH